MSCVQGCEKCTKHPSCFYWYKCSVVNDTSSNLGGDAIILQMTLKWVSSSSSFSCSPSCFIMSFSISTDLPSCCPLGSVRATERRERERGVGRMRGMEEEREGGEGRVRWLKVPLICSQHDGTFHKRWSFGLSAGLRRCMKRVSNMWENGPCPVRTTVCG